MFDFDYNTFCLWLICMVFFTNAIDLSTSSFICAKGYLI